MNKYTENTGAAIPWEMNRAARRALEKQRRRNRHYRPDEITVPFPTVLDEWVVFNNITRILDRIATIGELEHEKGQPMFMNEEGRWFPICPSLEGWIRCWERIDRECQLGLIQDNLAKLHNKLRYMSPITAADIAAANAVVNKQRRWFRKLDRQLLTRLAKTEQVAMFMEGMAA